MTDREDFIPFGGHDPVQLIAALERRIQEQATAMVALRRQLPSSMQHCTIVFKQCEIGHSWLTATNWVQHECPTCERDALRAALDEKHATLVRMANRRPSDGELKALASLAEMSERCAKAEFRLREAEPILAEVRRFKHADPRTLGVAIKDAIDDEDTPAEIIYRKVVDTVTGKVDESWTAGCEGCGTKWHETPTTMRACPKCGQDGEPKHNRGGVIRPQHIREAQAAAREHAQERVEHFGMGFVPLPKRPPPTTEADHLRAAQLAAREHVVPHLRAAAGAAAAAGDLDSAVVDLLMAELAEGTLDKQLVAYARALIRFIENNGRPDITPRHHPRCGIDARGCVAACTFEKDQPDPVCRCGHDRGSHGPDGSSCECCTEPGGCRCDRFEVGA